jgi:hypothetical protein
MKEEKQAQLLVKKFIAHGFRVGEAYTIPEMDGVKLLSFYKEAYIAVLYTHPIAGLWVDLVAKSEDGSELTVTDMPVGAEISNRPEMKKVVMKGASIDEMVEQLYELTSGHSLQFIHQDDFRSFFEDAYKRDIQWRNRNGGISYEDFISVEQEMKQKHTDKQIKEAFLETKLQELDQWHHSIVEQYIEKNQLKVDDERFPAISNSILSAVKSELLISKEFKLIRSRWKRLEKRLFKRKKSVEVRFIPHDSYTIIEISTTDRLGLLYKITDVLNKLDLDVYFAKIATMGEDVVDTFYTLHRTGRLIRKDMYELIREELTTTIDKFLEN